MLLWYGTDGKPRLGAERGLSPIYPYEREQLSQSRLLALTTSPAQHSFYTTHLSRLILVRLRFLSLAGVCDGYTSGVFERFDNSIESIPSSRDEFTW